MRFAMAKISGGEKYPEIKGKVLLEQKKGKVLITAHICNLPDTDTGIFGFHIHEGEICTGESFVNTKGHYNPYNSSHPKHSGDMPNLFANEGRAYLSFETSRFSLCEVIEKSMVIHLSPDDYKSQPSGNSGDKIACGIIKKL